MTQIKVLAAFTVSGLPAFEVGTLRLADAATAVALAERGLVEIMEESKQEPVSKKDTKSK